MNAPLWLSITEFLSGFFCGFGSRSSGMNQESYEPGCETTPRQLAPRKIGPPPALPWAALILAANAAAGSRLFLVSPRLPGISMTDSTAPVSMISSTRP